MWQCVRGIRPPHWSQISNSQSSFIMRWWVGACTSVRGPRCIKRETLDCQSTHGVPDVNIIDRSALSRTPQSTPFIALTPTHASLHLVHHIPTQVAVTPACSSRERAASGRQWSARRASRQCNLIARSQLRSSALCRASGSFEWFHHLVVWLVITSVLCWVC